MMAEERERRYTHSGQLEPDISKISARIVKKLMKARWEW